MIADEENDDKLYLNVNDNETEIVCKSDDCDDEDIDDKHCDEIHKKVFDAAENGDVETLEYYLKSDINLVHIRDSDDYTPLHRAAYNNHLSIAKLLIDYGADVRAQTCDKWHPIHSACKWSHVEMVNLLVQNGADLNALSNGGNTPLHLASGNKNNTQLLEYLLFHHDIHVDLKNNAGDTAYDIAKRSGSSYKLWDYL